VNRDFLDMLSALSAAGAEYLVVGAHALAAHGVPRATGDIDLWVRPTPDNADRVLQALGEFGAPLFDLTRADLIRDDTVLQIGLPPARIDLLTGISGVTFDDAWPRRLEITLPELPFPVPVLSREDFVRNKRAAGRAKDRADLDLLGEDEEG
jgi:hypothetical protein